MDEEDQVAINMVRPHVNVVIPAIYSRNPDVLVFPRRKEQVGDEVVRKRAEVMQSLLRYYLKELDIKTEVKLCILDAVLTGHGWMKTGYESKFVDDNVEQKKSLIEKIREKMSPINPDEENEEEEYYNNIKIVEENPWVLRVSPFDLFVPALSRRPEELTWIDERIILPHEEVLANPEYDTSGLKPSCNANELLAALRGAGGRASDLQFGNDIYFDILHEVWDSYSQQVITLCEGHNDKALCVKPSAYTMLDTKFHPYISLRFNEISDEFYCQGDIDPASPQLEELNEIRSKLNTHLRRFNRAYSSRPSALDPIAKKQLQDKEDGAVIEVSQTYEDKPLSDIIQPIIDAPLSPDVYAIETRVKDDIFTILGTSDYASQASGGARTATEASIIATQSRFKVEERIDLVGMFVERIIRNIAQLSQYYMNVQQIEAILGEDAVYWIQVNSRREIQGEFSYGVTYGSSAPINRDTETEQFMKAYMIMKDDPYFDQQKLRLELIRKSNFFNPESWLNPQIAQELERQRLIAAKQGMLLQGPENPVGSPLPAPRAKSQATGPKLPTGQPRGIGAARPAVPGGVGGTSLAGKSGY